MRHTKREAILDMLRESRGKPMYGLEMIKASNGRLKRGTVYVVLNQMETAGFVESWKEPQADGSRGNARRLYRMTDKGWRLLAVLREHRALTT